MWPPLSVLFNGRSSNSVAFIWSYIFQCNSQLCRHSANCDVQDDSWVKMQVIFSSWKLEPIDTKTSNHDTKCYIFHTLSDFDTVNNSNLQLLQNKMPALTAPYQLFTVPVNINPCHHFNLYNHHHHDQASEPRVSSSSVQVVWSECWWQNSAHCSWLPCTDEQHLILSLLHDSLWVSHLWTHLSLLSLWGTIILCGQEWAPHEVMAAESYFLFQSYC